MFKTGGLGTLAPTGVLTRTADVGRTSLESRSSARLPQLATFRQQLQDESAIAGGLLFLVERKSHVLANIFYATADDTEKAAELTHTLAAAESIQAYLDINTMNPGDQNDINSVALSPISVVHLFRQYSSSSTRSSARRSATSG